MQFWDSAWSYTQFQASSLFQMQIFLLPWCFTHLSATKCKWNFLARCNFRFVFNAYLIYIFLHFRIFGALLILCLLDLNFIMNQFKLLRTFTGRGLFNLFLASMFLVGNDDEVYGFVMLGGLVTVGLFFILIGCACIKDTDKSALKRNTEEAAKGDANDGLLNTANWIHQIFISSNQYYSFMPWNQF